MSPRPPSRQLPIPQLDSASGSPEAGAENQAFVTSKAAAPHLEQPAAAGAVAANNRRFPIESLGKQEHGVVTRFAYPDKKWGFVERQTVSIFFHVSNLAAEQRPEDISLGDVVSFYSEVRPSLLTDNCTECALVACPAQVDAWNGKVKLCDVKVVRKVSDDHLHYASISQLHKTRGILKDVQVSGRSNDDRWHPGSDQLIFHFCELPDDCPLAQLTVGTKVCFHVTGDGQRNNPQHRKAVNLKVHWN